MSEKEIIAKRIAQEIQDGSVVNLGIGMPTLVANYIDENKNITFHSENGFIGIGKSASGDGINKNITNAGGQFVTVTKNAVFFDSAMSFGIVRGGHIDVTVLGGLEVDQEGNLANYMVRGKKIAGMGGAMDLVVGAKKVIVAMTHTSKGKSKILKKCTLPLTGCNVVDMIVTELGVFEFKKDGLHLVEIMPDVTLEKILELTEASVIVSLNK